MSVTHMTCDRCSQNIPYGAAYISICYNIEQMEKDVIRLVDSVTIVSSRQITTLCGRCGNRHNAAAVKQILKTTLSTALPQSN